MKRLDPTDIIVTAAHVEAALRDIERFDISEFDADQVKPRARARRRPEPLPELSASFRRVHVEGYREREPIDGEPYMIVERVGDFETTIMPYNFDGGQRMYVPRFGGPWEITEISDNGKWVTWIRLAKGARS
jgi:hypothetical protein